MLGSAWAFAGAILVIVIWGLTGPTFHYSNTVDDRLMSLNQPCKRIEVIRALKGARNELIDLEKLADEDLTSLEKQFERVRKKAERNGNNLGA